jgi:hypothetical protein
MDGASKAGSSKSTKLKPARIGGGGFDGGGRRY